VYILNLAHGVDQKDDEQAITDMISIAFFFLLRPGEYTITTTDDAFFRMQDVSLYVGARCLDTMLSSHAELQAATSVAYTFTTQKNGKCGEKMIHSRSGNVLCCPVCASIRRYYRGIRRIAVKARDVTTTLRPAMTANVTSTEPVSRPMKSAPGVYALLAQWRCFVARSTSTLSASLGDDAIAMP
jgi:hypothetical protein